MVEGDTTDVGEGAVLSQWAATDNKLHPCAILSWRLTPAERNYVIGNLEPRDWTPVKPDGPSSSPESTFLLLPARLPKHYTRRPVPLVQGSLPKPEYLLLAPCLDEAITWEINVRVKSALEHQPGPSTCPLIAYLFPDSKVQFPPGGPCLQAFVQSGDPENPSLPSLDPIIAASGIVLIYENLFTCNGGEWDFICGA